MKNRSTSKIQIEAEDIAEFFSVGIVLFLFITFAVLAIIGMKGLEKEQDRQTETRYINTVSYEPIDISIFADNNEKTVTFNTSDSISYKFTENEDISIIINPDYDPFKETIVDCVTYNNGNYNHKTYEVIIKNK